MTRSTRKVAVVTGGSKGLGPHLARALIEADFRVALLARSSSELVEVAAALGPDAHDVACDVSDPSSVRSAFSQVARWGGRLDLLVNNAAVALPNRIVDAPDDDILDQVRTNLVGPMLCLRAAIPLLSDSGGGNVVNVSSTGVRVHAPHLSVYDATKGGLESFSEAARRELRERGIKVTVLRLGAVRTGKGLTRSWRPEQKEAYLAAVRAAGTQDLVGGWMEPQSVAGVLVGIVTAADDVVPDLVELSGR